MIELVLAGAALLIGATGAWSPCGLSVVETIGPTGHSGGRRITAAACVTFLPGAIAGGVVTFGALGLLGQQLHGAGGSTAYLLAAGIAAIAALLELRGTRIFPQIRRQLPEHWRRVMPMPAAAALYGVLLGLGFTTFVLSFGVWALAGISLAVGEPLLGAVIGACFGLGRALPVVALAPVIDTDRGIRATELMCERPSLYRGLRFSDGLALVLAASVLALGGGDAGAADVVAAGAGDPVAVDSAVVFERTDGSAAIFSGGTISGLPGADPAIGGPFVAVRQGNAVRLLDRKTLDPVGQLIAAPGADALAVSGGWLVHRARRAKGGDAIYARRITNPRAPGKPARVAISRGAGQLSAPSVDGSTLTYAAATPRGSRIVLRVLGTRKARVLTRLRRGLVFSPAVRGRSFTYVRTDRKRRRSRLMLRRLQARGAGHVLLSLGRRKGLLSSTALAPRSAYVTVLKPSSGRPSARLIRVSRGKSRKQK